MTSTTSSQQEPSQGSHRGELVYSFSTLKDYTVCPARTYYKKLARLGILETDLCLPASFGSAGHLGIEMRLKHGRDPYKVAEDSLHDELETVGYKGFVTDDYKDRMQTLNRCLSNFEENFYGDLMATIRDPEKSVEISLEMPYRKGVLVGKVDVALPGIVADWKFGAIPKLDKDLQTGLQHFFYHRLLGNSVLGSPKLFEYVYLQGKNIAMALTKTGKVKKNIKEPEYKFSWPVITSSEETDKAFRERIDPIAKAYESGVVWKNPSHWNCSSCKFRTACWSGQYPLPETGE